MRFHYEGSNQVPSYCDIEIIGNLVIAKEVQDNPGQSITNAAEVLATTVCLRNSIPMQDVVWIEKYQHRPGEADLVQFIHDGEKLTNPYWKRLKGNELPLLIASQRDRLKGSD